MHQVNEEFFAERSKGPRHKIFKRETNKGRVNQRFTDQYYVDNDIIIAKRQHSLTDQNDVPIYEKFLRPVVYTDTKDDYCNDVLSISHSNYSDRDYNDTSYFGEEPSQGIDAEHVFRNLTAIGRFLEILQTVPLPRLSLTTACICFIIAIFISPRPCVENIIFPAFRLTFGTLYPAYASYKAVRTKNVKEYVKWMMYWIVYAFFTCTETFTDIFLSWFPFYYEVKVIIVLWLLSPATKGSSTLYRKFVHPMLTRREQEIDEYLNQAKERGYSAVLQLGSKGVNYATNVIMQTAIKTFHYGLNATNHQQSILPSSQSDDDIYARRSIRNGKEFDEIDNAQWVPKSSSLNSMPSMHVEFSEDDEQIFDIAIDEEESIATEDAGAARIRDPPVRKTKNKEPKSEITKRSKLSNHSLKVPTSGLRPRRKLREATPDINVDVGGGNLVQTIRRSYSLSDLSEPDIHRTEDEVDDVVTMRPQQRMLRQRLNTPVGRSASGTRHSTGMYFTEVDVSAKGAGDFNYNIRSSDDISSGYSSAEPISGGLSRTSSMSNASKSRLKAKRSEVEFNTCEDRLNFELDSKLSENEDEYRDKMNHESEMDLVFEDNIDTIEKQNFEQSIEEYFETKSNASDYTSDMEDNNLNNSIEDQKFVSSDPYNNSFLHKSINLNEMRTSLKEIENNFRTNIKGSCTSNYNTQKAYVHKKGKAPQPPTAQPTLNIKNSDQEKMSASCTTLPRSKKNEKTITATALAKTRAKHEK
ncbi:Receptor expression-enhancing protein 2 [Lucilia cuprina]|nr:Receptor expression-enhancing protein 2 [Lucilia cuprina]